MPRSFSSFALSICSKGVKGLTSGIFSCSTRVIAAVSVVLPWSMCPMVPMLTCGLVRWNFAFATGVSSLRAAPPQWVWSVSWFLYVCYCAPRSLLAARLGDDLLGDARRHLGVGVELHAVVRPALRLAAQVPDVTEHLRQRDESLDHSGPGSFLHGLNLAAAAVQVADHVAHVVLGRRDLDAHHRLEQHRTRLRGGLLEGHRAGDLEGELRGVHLMEGPVGQRHLDVDHREPGQHAELGGFLAPGVHRRDVLPRDAAAGHLVLELIAAAVTAGRLQVDDHAAELAGTTGLLLVRVLDLLDLPGDGLPVGDLRAADVGLDPELAPHPVDQHLEVQFAHARDDRLPGLLVGPDLEGRVLLGQPLDGGAQLLLVTLGPRLDRHVDHGRREGHRFQDHRGVLGAQRVPGGGVLQAHHGDDLPGGRERALLALVRVHLVDLADPLPAALDRVQHLGAALQRPRVHPDVGELAQVLVGHDLEGQRRERLLRVGVPLDRLPLVAYRVALDGRDVQRARQVVDDGVEHGLHALVLERRAAQHRGERAGDRRPADRGDELLLGGLSALEVQLHHLVVILGDGLEQPVTPLAGRLDVVGGDVDVLVLVALALGLPEQPAHPDQVDDAAEVGLDAPGKLDDQRRGAETVGNHLHAAVELGAYPVYLVHEADPRHAIPVGLAPDSLRLRLHAGHGVEHGDGAVEHPQRAFHLDGEVHVPGRIDDVDRVVTPGRGGRGGRDRDAALLLLLHPVHGRGALMDFTDLVVDAGVEQDALGSRSLARVDMRHDPDVADLGEVYCGLGGHVKRPSFSFSFSLLPAVVRESLVGLRHLVRVLTALNARAKAVAGVQQLVHQPLGHRLL